MAVELLFEYITSSVSGSRLSPSTAINGAGLTPELSGYTAPEKVAWDRLSLVMGRRMISCLCGEFLHTDRRIVMF